MLLPVRKVEVREPTMDFENGNVWRREQANNVRWLFRRENPEREVIRVRFGQSLSYLQRHNEGGGRQRGGQQRGQPRQVQERGLLTQQRCRVRGCRG